MRRKRKGWSRIAAKEVEEEGRREREEGARLCCGLANTRRCLDTLAPETYSGSDETSADTSGWNLDAG